MFVEVRTLAGASVRLDVAPSTLVGELKDSVSSAFCQATRYVLYFGVRIVGWVDIKARGAPLNAFRSIESLFIEPGQYLTALPSRKRRTREGKRGSALSSAACERGEPQDHGGLLNVRLDKAESASATPPAESTAEKGGWRKQAAAPAAAPASPTALGLGTSLPLQLDTLLPGYALRPHPSPQKDAASWARSEEGRGATVGESGAQEPLCSTTDASHLQSLLPSLPHVSPLPATLLAVSRLPPPFRSPIPSDAARAGVVAAAQLAPDLRRLEAAFAALNAVLIFVERARLQNLLSAVLRISGSVWKGGCLTSEDVRLLAAVAPGLVVLKKREIDTYEAQASVSVPEPAQETTRRRGSEGAFEDEVVVSITDVGRDKMAPGSKVPAAFAAGNPLGETAASEGQSESKPPRTQNRALRQAWAFRCFLVAAMDRAAVGRKESEAGRAGGETGMTQSTPMTHLMTHPDHASCEAPPPSLRCSSTSPLDVSTFCEHLTSLKWYRGQVTHLEQLPARTSRLETLAPSLAPAVAAALASRGVRSFYAHQARAMASLRAGRPTVVATATASGKSACYCGPLLEELLRDPNGTALCLFPTKALARDQLEGLRGLCDAAEAWSRGTGGGDGEEGGVGPGSTTPLHVEVYDGDTPAEERVEIKRRARLVLSNPDTVHASLLPGALRGEERMGGGGGDAGGGSTSLAPSDNPAPSFLRHLRFVVVDEAHVYRGVFGAHVALVLRRLRRACLLAGAAKEPVPVLCTATIGNPAQHAEALWGVSRADWVLVDEDGSPQAARDVILWNPPVIQAESVAAVEAQREERPDVESMGRPALASKKRRSSAVVRAAEEEGDPLLRPTENDRATKGSGAPPPGLALELPPPLSPVSLKRLEAQRRSARAAIAGVVAPSADGKQSSLTESGRGPTWHSRRRFRGASRGRHRSRSDAQPPPPPAGPAALDDARAAFLKSLHDDALGDGPGLSARRPRPRRASAIVEIALLFAEAVQHGLRTIAFCKSRKMCELVTSYAREFLEQSSPGLTSAIAVYRGGYSPLERRAIEQSLFANCLLGVVATNALELGVDVGGLDVTLHLGCPSSAASLWQQVGRAGRRGRPALSLVVLRENPLDQHYAAHPEKLFARAPESAALDASGALESHLLCAAHEAPLMVERGVADAAREGRGWGSALEPSGNGHEEIRAVPSLAFDDARFFGPQLVPAARSLLRSGLLAAAPCARSAPSRRLVYAAANAAPQRAVSLRSIEEARVAVVDETLDREIESIERSAAPFQVYEGAVYMHQGRTYLCRSLDLDGGLAVVRPARVKYYTRLRVAKVITLAGSGEHVVALGFGEGSESAEGGQNGSKETGDRRDAPELDASLPRDASSISKYPTPPPVALCSPATITTRFLGFHRIWRGSNVLFDTVPLFLPDARMQTQVLAIGIPDVARRLLGERLLESAHAAVHALWAAVPLLVLCDASDVEAECSGPGAHRTPRLLLYDTHEGGSGVVQAAARALPELLSRALDILEQCNCQDEAGCPCCVQLPVCKEYNSNLCKPGGSTLLKYLQQCMGHADREMS